MVYHIEVRGELYESWSVWLGFVKMSDNEPRGDDLQQAGV